MLLNHDVHLVARRELFDSHNDFYLRMCAKGTAYAGWPNFSIYFGLTDDIRCAQ